MKTRNGPVVFAASAVVTTFFGVGSLLGCANQHEVAPAAAGQVSLCSKCYQSMRTVMDSQGRRSGPSVNRTIATHSCEDCKSEMTVYEEGGVLKVRCATCAPAGVDCDLCVPKK